MTDWITTTPVEASENLFSLLEAVTQENKKVCIVLSSGKQAVMVSEEELNSMRAQLQELQRERRETFLTDPNTKKYETAEEMHRDILGELYEELHD